MAEIDLIHDTLYIFSPKKLKKLLQYESFKFIFAHYVQNHMEEAFR